jgi:TonB family protein
VSAPGPRRGAALAWAASVLVHAAGLGSGAVLVARWASPEAPPPPRLVAAMQREIPFEIELPPMRTSGDHWMASPTASGQAPAPERPGGAEVQRLDQGRVGRGGDAAGMPAMNLADQDDGLLLARDLFSRPERSQLQRLRTAADRASFEDRRSTWSPMELTFLASGAGHRAERRPAAERDPSLGERAAASPVPLGGPPGAASLPPGEGESPRDPGAIAPGGPRAFAARGVADGAPGQDARESAAVAFARPAVAEGRPAVPAVEVDRPRDRVDSEQEVSSMVQSLLHASPFGGRPGEGRSGEAGPGAPGAGGSQGPGASGRPSGRGPGASPEPASGDPLGAYTRLVFGRVNAAWGLAFPKEQASVGRQGLAIVDFTILADGKITGVSLARSSGLPEFDEIVRRAILRSAPFPPLPPAFGSSRAWRIAFDAKNPAVR